MTQHNTKPNTRVKHYRYVTINDTFIFRDYEKKAITLTLDKALIAEDRERIRYIRIIRLPEAFGMEKSKEQTILNVREFYLNYP